MSGAIPPIRWKPDFSVPTVRAVARYRRDESVLVVGPDGRPAYGDARMSAGTTTFVFAGRERLLVGLDAYTNSQLWESAALLVPPAPEGRLGVLAAFDENGIAAGPSAGPSFRHDAERALLAIDVGSGEPHSTCRCFTSAVAELGPDWELLTLYVEGVDIRGAG
jgi:hypothetical protein